MKQEMYLIHCRNFIFSSCECMLTGAYHTASLSDTRVLIGRQGTRGNAVG